ncbi:glycosyltransferase family 4 protein [Olivibacter sp. SDN3]|uniref:glycosyltransferase family 4 protein n=1 Tax=Olivibacter sp. SDN3 TaxID=2764720 RepID=UPI00165145B7|nr:glycosyltransferase family 4 protein [Olivibacter sp. SDN3]QNL52088.1 glycosyltransferase family 4 protein [Olivibacter sp. SDN3]
MKILYINALYSPDILGGAELSLKVLVEAMQANGHEVAVLSLQPAGRLKEEYVDGVKVYRAPLKNRYWPFHKSKPGKWARLRWHLKDRYNRQMRTYVRKVIAKENPTIISCHNLVGWSIAVWDEIKKSNLPLVQVLHDLYLLCPNSDMFKGNASCQHQCLQCKLLRSKHRKLSAKVDAVVGISNFILKRFNHFHYFPYAQKHVIYNSRQIPPPPLPSDRKVYEALKVGYIGTLAEKKGIEWLIQQFEQLQINATLTIAGAGKKDYEEHLHAITKAPNIAFIGSTDSTLFYKEVDVLVVPSLWQEPLGMVAIEALANHLPVIANNIGGLRETVKHEVNGLLCESADPNSLGKAILRLNEDMALYNRLMKNARSSVEAILDKERMINEYAMVLNGTTNKHINA